MSDVNDVRARPVKLSQLWKRKHAVIVTDYFLHVSVVHYLPTLSYRNVDNIMNGDIVVWCDCVRNLRNEQMCMIRLPNMYIQTLWKNVRLVHFLSMLIWFDLIWFLVFNATFSNISAISWRPVLVMEEAGVPGENYRPWASNW